MKLVRIQHPLTVKRDCNRELARTWRMLSTSRFIHGVSWRNWISSILSRITLTASESLLNGTKYPIFFFFFNYFPDGRECKRGGGIPLEYFFTASGDHFRRRQNDQNTLKFCQKHHSYATINIVTSLICKFLLPKNI